MKLNESVSKHNSYAYKPCSYARIILCLCKHEHASECLHVIRLQQKDVATQTVAAVHLTRHQCPLVSHLSECSEQTLI